MSELRTWTRAEIEAEAHRITVLSPRQLEVLRLVAGGYTDAEIGAIVHVSRSTVKWHLYIVFEKLGTRSRVQAVALAYEAGLLGMGDARPEVPGG
jgi:DNA-binding CsgD family transcriptional regulator